MIKYGDVPKPPGPADLFTVDYAALINQRYDAVFNQRNSNAVQASPPARNDHHRCAYCGTTGTGRCVSCGAPR